jgi:hypothetical protein
VIDGALKQSILQSVQMIVDHTHVPKNVRHFNAAVLVETQIVDPDFYTEMQDSSWCVLCANCSPNIKNGKQVAWVCCGLIACVQCITDYYLFDLKAQCPWCGAVFGDEWEFKDLFHEAHTSCPNISASELSNVHSKLAERGMKKT